MAETILLIGTLDTKGAEFAYVRGLITERGHKTVVMDTGVGGEPPFVPDISATEVAEAGHKSLTALREAGDRGAALTVMGEGARVLALKAYVDGQVDGVLSLGGSGGTSIATTAMQALPIGFPKVMVSTMASGDVAPYVGVKDITMMYSVVDVAGLNRISRQVFCNAVGAICGMVEQTLPEAEDKPLITASMFGVTTPCVTAVREKLEAAGYEVLVFHATGSGGRAMEALIDGGFITGVADITTTEWCDELVGGVLSAGPTRLDAAAKNGVPQVVSLGALDMVNFGGMETIPQKFKDRILYVHNPQVTLMRTTPGECAELGKIIAAKLNQCTGPATLFVPLKGVSMIDAEGQPFHSPEADQALFRAVRDNLDTDKVELIEMNMNINDLDFAVAVANRLLRMLSL
ncbi:MAG: Tm-1-like ATP-binding domain-containing protein [Chloroflexi bacterium]|nr:Tm-1-like ATP-binding domain-containing protein [Chloroflexota bacterium]